MEKKKPKNFREWFPDAAKECGIGGPGAFKFCEVICSEWQMKRRGSDRSLAQNNFYRGPLLDAFVDSFGDTDKEYLHALLKERLLSTTDKKGRPYIKSTADLTIKEFSEFIDGCLKILMDHGGSLPDEAVMEYRHLTKGGGNLTMEKKNAD